MNRSLLCLQFVHIDWATVSVLKWELPKPIWKLFLPTIKIGRTWTWSQVRRLRWLCRLSLETPGGKSWLETKDKQEWTKIWDWKNGVQETVVVVPDVAGDTCEQNYWKQKKTMTEKMLDWKKIGPGNSFVVVPAVADDTCAKELFRIVPFCSCHLLGRFCFHYIWAGGHKAW